MRDSIYILSPATDDENEFFDLDMRDDYLPDYEELISQFDAENIEHFCAIYNQQNSVVAFHCLNDLISFVHNTVTPVIFFDYVFEDNQSRVLSNQALRNVEKSYLGYSEEGDVFESAVSDFIDRYECFEMHRDPKQATRLIAFTYWQGAQFVWIADSGYLTPKEYIYKMVSENRDLVFDRIDALKKKIRDREEEEKRSRGDARNKILETVLADKRFQSCTNKQLRAEYADSRCDEDVFKTAFCFDSYDGPIYNKYEARKFIESIWAHHFKK